MSVSTERSGMTYSEEEKAFFENVAKVISDREEMERISSYIAAGMQRE